MLLDSQAFRHALYKVACQHLDLLWALFPSSQDISGHRRILVDFTRFILREELGLLLPETVTAGVLNILLLVG